MNCSSVTTTALWAFLVLATDVCAERTQRLIFSGASVSEAEASAAVLREAYSRLGIDIESFGNLVPVEIPVSCAEAIAFSARRDLDIRGWYSLWPLRVGIVSRDSDRRAGHAGDGAPSRRVLSSTSRPAGRGRDRRSDHAEDYRCDSAAGPRSVTGHTHGGSWAQQVCEPPHLPSLQRSPFTACTRARI